MNERGKMRTGFDQDWEALGDEILSGMKEWRLQHPRATLREMEAALDERLGALRARMLQDMAMASAAAEQKEGVQLCPECGQEMKPKGGSPKRELLTRAKRQIELERQRWECPACGAAIFPPG
jgi:NADH pyrophosphatase NudC (nudix superfamily)